MLRTTIGNERIKAITPTEGVFTVRANDQGGKRSERLPADEFIHRYCLLREAGQLTHRRTERPSQPRAKPRALIATQCDQIYCWDITYLPTLVRGQFFYLYLFVDIFSRKIAGWQVFTAKAPSMPVTCSSIFASAKASHPSNSLCTQATARP